MRCCDAQSSQSTGYCTWHELRPRNILSQLERTTAGRCMANSRVRSSCEVRNTKTPQKALPMQHKPERASKLISSKGVSGSPQIQRAVLPQAAWQHYTLLRPRDTSRRLRWEEQRLADVWRTAGSGQRCSRTICIPGTLCTYSFMSYTY